MRKIVVLFIFFGLWSCSNNEVPEDILNRDKFIEILVDVHVTDAMLTNQQLYDRKYAKDSTKSYYNWIYIKHKVNKEDFDKTMEFYTNHPELFNKLYDDVLNNLHKKETEIVGDSTANDVESNVKRKDK